MKVRALKHCDAQLSERNKRALFEGQEYDLPVPVARELIADGKAVEAKAVHGPPEDKAVGPSEDKGICGTCSRKFKALPIHQRMTGHK